MAPVRERPVRFGRHGKLVGVLTEPSSGAHGDSSVVLLNAGIIHRVGPSRFAVEVARGLAEEGYRVLRFDLSGIGDSEPVPGEKLEETVRLDILDAVDLVASKGIKKTTLVGLCSGADNAFAAAGDDPRITGLVLIDPTVHRTAGFYRRRVLARIRTPDFWWRAVNGGYVLRWLRNRLSRSRSPSRPPGYYGLLSLNKEDARSQAAGLTRRGVRFLYVLTNGVKEYCNAPEQVAESLPGSFHGNLRTEWRQEADHLLSRSADRKWLTETVLYWLSTPDRPDGSHPQDSGGGENAHRKIG